MKRVPVPAVVALVVAGTLAGAMWRPETASGQSSGTVEQRLTAIEGELKAMRKELQQVLTAMQQARGGSPAAAQAPPAPAALPEHIAIAGAPGIGQANAPLTLVEFSDFECPFCGRYNRETFPQLKREYIDTGKVRYVFRHFPLERSHPRAMKAGEAAACAHAQGKFWPMHDVLFANQKALGDDQLVGYAKAIGLTMPSFQQCFAGQAVAGIRRDLDEGARGGVTGTPAFFIGAAPGGDGRMRVYRRLGGAQPYAAFKAVLDELLANPKRAS